MRSKIASPLLFGFGARVRFFNRPAGAAECVLLPLLLIGTSGVTDQLTSLVVAESGISEVFGLVLMKAVYKVQGSYQIELQGA